MFEHSLMSLDKKKSTRRRWLSLPIAVGVHLAALATFTLASYWHVEGVGERNLIPPYESPPLVVLLPERTVCGRPLPSREKLHTQAQKPAAPVQPAPSADRLPALETAPASVSVADAPSDLDTPGVPETSSDSGPGDGKRESHSASSESGPQTAEPGDGPVYVTGAVTRPVLLDAPQPRYSEMERHAGKQGTIVLNVVIDESGRVTRVTVAKTLTPGLDQAAVDAVKSWRFKPSTLAGRPVKVYYTLTINFALQRL